MDQDLARNPNGYSGRQGCGVPCKSAELRLGERAQPSVSRGFTQEVRLSVAPGPRSSLQTRVPLQVADGLDGQLEDFQATRRQQFRLFAVPQARRTPAP